MRSSTIILVALINFIILNICYGTVSASETKHLNSNYGQYDRKLKYDSDLSFENEDEQGEDSFETSRLAKIGPSEIEAFLNKRGLKQGFNAWAGKRSATQMKKLRRPWNGK